MSYIYSGVPLCFLRLLATGPLPCMIISKLRALCSSACGNSQIKVPWTA